MAIWQFELQVVPAQQAMIEGQPAIYVSDETRSAMSLHLTPKVRGSLIDVLNQLLPAQTSWSSGLLIWGSTRGTDVQLFLNEADTDTMHVRIDARTFTHDFIDSLCAIANEYGWVFLTERGAVVKPDTVAVLRALLSSPARAYVENAQRVIDAAAEKIYLPI